MPVPLPLPEPFPAPFSAPSILEPGRYIQFEATLRPKMFVQTHGIHAEIMGVTYHLTMKMSLEMLISFSKDALQGSKETNNPLLLLRSVLSGDTHTSF